MMDAIISGNDRVPNGAHSVHRNAYVGRDVTLPQRNKEVFYMKTVYWMVKIIDSRIRDRRRIILNYLIHLSN